MYFEKVVRIFTILNILYIYKEKKKYKNKLLCDIIWGVFVSQDAEDTIIVFYNDLY